MGLADIGTQRVRAEHLRYEHEPSSSYDHGRDAAHDSFGGYGGYGGDVVVGATSPTLIYDQMRRMDLDATALDTDFAVNVSDPGVKQAWAAWFRDWKAFFAKTLTLSGKIANVFSSDDLRETVNSRDRDLAGFHEIYARQLTSSGQPVPPSRSPGAPTPLSDPNPPPPPDAPWWSFPWWGYALGVVVVGGIGYSFYRAHQRVKAQVAWGEKYASQGIQQLLPGVGPMPLSRDPAPAQAPTVLMPVHMTAQPPLSTPPV